MSGPRALRRRTRRATSRSARTSAGPAGAGGWWAARRAAVAVLLGVWLVPGTAEPAAEGDRRRFRRAKLPERFTAPDGTEYRRVATTAIEATGGRKAVITVPLSGKPLDVAGVCEGAGNDPATGVGRRADLAASASEGARRPCSSSAARARERRGGDGHLRHDDPRHGLCTGAERAAPACRWSRSAATGPWPCTSGRHPPSRSSRPRSRTFPGGWGLEADGLEDRPLAAGHHGALRDRGHRAQARLRPDLRR